MYLPNQREQFKIYQVKTLNDTIDQLDLIDIYRTFHPKTMNVTFSSSAHRTFSRIDHIMCHKSSLGKFKKTEIIPSIFSDHNAVRLDLNYRSCCCCCYVASVVSNSVRPHRWQPTRLPHPWDSPGKSTGVGCHCLLRGHKSSLGKFKKNEIIPSIFSDHNAVRLDLSYRKKLLKIPTYGG